jgi:hypothetical protein
MRWGRALVAAVCGPILVLAGCSDGENPVVLPSSSGSATTTPPTETTTPTDPPSSEPTPTTTLLLPDEHVPEVDEFVQAFFAAYNAAQDSGDFTAWDAMYLPQCAGCKTMRDEIEAWLANGGTVEGADWVILQQSSAVLADSYTATAVGFRTAGEVSGDSGMTIEQTPAQQFNIFLLTTPKMAVADLAWIDA